MGTLLVLLVFVGGTVNAADADPSTAVSLRNKYDQLKQQKNSPFGRPLYLESAEYSSRLKGDIYALVDYPLATVSAALESPAQWCDVLILHLNTKYCRAKAGTPSKGLIVRIGKKNFQRLEDAYHMDFSYRLIAATAEYFEAGLDAENGPMSTHNYLIVLNAIAISDKQTFLHLTYSYDFGGMGSIAMSGYLATVGRNKVGFTKVGDLPDGRPQYIGGVRGVVERNTMRYYLAIDAYLAGLASPPAEQLERRLENWFSATEKYPLQLHELDRAEYIDMKHREYERQRQTGP